MQIQVYFISTTVSGSRAAYMAYGNVPVYYDRELAEREAARLKNQFSPEFWVSNAVIDFDQAMENLGADETNQEPRP